MASVLFCLLKYSSIKWNSCANILTIAGKQRKHTRGEREERRNCKTPGIWLLEMTIKVFAWFFGKKRYFAEITSFHWGYKTTLRIAWEMQHANQICIHWKYLLVFLKEKNLEGRTKKMLIEKRYCARNARLMRGGEGTRFSWQRIVVAIYFKSPCDSSASSISSISSASGPPVWPEPSLPSS